VIPEILLRRTTALSLPLICSLMIVAFASQSGRRLPNQNPPPKTSDSKNKEEEKQDEGSRPDRLRTPLAIVNYLSNATMSSFPAEAVSEACAQRLKKSGAFTISMGREANRKQASDMAKNSPDTFVLWLNHEIEGPYDPRTTIPGRVDNRNYFINYVLYAPVTGKSRTDGRIYLRGGVGVPLPGSGGTLRTVYDRAGYDIADRILNIFNAPGSRRP